MDEPRPLPKEEEIDVLILPEPDHWDDAPIDHAADPYVEGVDKEDSGIREFLGLPPAPEAEPPR